MNLEIKMLAILSGTPFLIFFIHMILVRILHNNTSAQMVAVKSAMLGYLPTALILWHFVFYYFNSSSRIISAAAYCFIIYSALAYTYFHFFNMSETARRIRILYEVYRAGTLPCEKIKAMYKSSDIVHLRLKRLISMKRLRYSDGYYSMDDKILYSAALFITSWRKIIGFNDNIGKAAHDKRENSRRL